MELGLVSGLVSALVSASLWAWGLVRQLGLGLASRWERAPVKGWVLLLALGPEWVKAKGLESGLG